MSYIFYSIGDLQARGKYSYGRIDPETRLNTRLIDTKLALYKVLDLAKADVAEGHEVDIFQLGDLYDSSNPDERVQMVISQWVRDAIDSGIRVRIILGNHDVAIGSHSCVVAASLSESKALSGHLDIIAKPKRIEGSAGLWFTIIPWCHLNDVIQALAEAQDDDVVLGHFEVIGATLGPADFVYSQGVTSSLLERFTHVQLGHFHIPQRWYVGSLVRDDFAELGDDKRVLKSVWSGGQLDVFSIPVPDRRFILMKLEDTYEPSRVKDAVIKLVVEGNASAYDKVKELEKAGAHRVVVKRIVKREEKKRKMISSSMPMKVAIDQYLRTEVPEENRAGVLKKFEELEEIWERS